MYSERRKVITSALDEMKIRHWAEATFYIWAKVRDSVEFAKRMLQLDSKNKIGINVTPGKMGQQSQPAIFY